MNDTAGVGRLQGQGDLPADIQRSRHGERASGQDVVERVAGDQLHDEVEAAVDLLQPVDGGDVGMVERRQQPGLALEAGQGVGVEVVALADDLDGHLAAQPAVAGAVDLAHAAAAQFLQYLVATARVVGRQGEPHRQAEPIELVASGEEGAQALGQAGVLPQERVAIGGAPGLDIAQVGGHHRAERVGRRERGRFVGHDCLGNGPVSGGAIVASRPGS